jgi:hypothetical protein
MEVCLICNTLDSIRLLLLLLGGGALGHPKVFINLDRNEPNECGYCGLRFEQEHDH